MVLSVVLLAANGYTKENTQDKTCETPCTVCEKDTFPDTCGYNCPADLDIKCGWNFYISGSFLYWQAREHGIDEGKLNVITHGTSMPFVKSPDFEYHPAFKVAIGGTSDHDRWNFRGQYTRFSAKNHGSFTGNTARLTSPDANNMDTIDQYFFTIYPSNVIFADSVVNQVKLTWKLDLNIADVDMGRTYFVGQKLVFNPFIGIKGGKLDQKCFFTTNYLNSADITQSAYDTLEAKIKTWLIGPRVGIDTMWKIGCGFRIFGNAAAALVYQDMKVDVDYAQPVQAFNATLFTTSSNNKTAHVVPVFECVLGLGWGSYFNDNSWHFDLTAGYELQSYLNQNGLIIPLTAISTPNADLSLHGLTLSAKIDF